MFYDAKLLTPGELEHYAGLGLVKGIEPASGARIARLWQSAIIDFEHEHDRADGLQQECADLEEENETLENLAEDAKANLRAVNRELRFLFVKYPNLKNSMSDLYAAFKQVESWELDAQ